MSECGTDSDRAHYWHQSSAWLTAIKHVAHSVTIESITDSVLSECARKMNPSREESIHTRKDRPRGFNCPRTDGSRVHPSRWSKHPLTPVIIVQSHACMHIITIHPYWCTTEALHPSSNRTVVRRYIICLKPSTTLQDMSGSLVVFVGCSSILAV